MINLIHYNFTIIIQFRISLLVILFVRHCRWLRDQNRVVLVGNQENFLSTDGKISIRMVNIFVLLRGRGKCTEIRYMLSTLVLQRGCNHDQYCSECC